ncbi:MAG: transketolase [Rickettsiaceae bacterium]|nr:transketolase [Rickettsiaceae bacterium]
MIQSATYKLLANSLRILSVDMVENAKSGHPGAPLGMADFFTILVAKFLRFNPDEPRWPARDRLIFSAGHASALLYSFFYLTGYKGYELDQIKSFRKITSNAQGHPEYDGIGPMEVTTGPLGQGFANAVGIAIAQKKYQARIGELMNYKTYCICGDGCLMEGLSYEAASIASHLKLDNLIVLFDSNNITIDGSLDLSNSENQVEKFRALGWNAFSTDGHDFAAIEHALNLSSQSSRPVFIEFKTKIGFASPLENSHLSHGSPLGPESIANLRKTLNWEHRPFDIPQEITWEWQNITTQNKQLYNKWQGKFHALAQDNKDYLSNNYYFALGDVDINTQHEATRKSSGRVIEVIAKNHKKLVIGSADLGESTFVKNKYCIPITKDDFSGNYINFGVREHAMAAIMNGLASQGFLTIGSSFLVFSDYARPAIRLAAIMNLPVIYIMTHDSVGVGEDGPTHQPVEHLASLRSIPNFNVYRPCDTREVVACFDDILSNHMQADRSKPSLIALTRQVVQTIPHEITKANVQKGAYVLTPQDKMAELTIWTSGSEVTLGLEVSRLLANENINARVVSCPNIELFFLQEEDYKQQLLDTEPEHTFAIEAGCYFGWDRIVKSREYFFGVDSFGKSGPSDEVFAYFELTPSMISKKIIDLLKESRPLTKINN